MSELKQFKCEKCGKKTWTIQISECQHCGGKMVEDASKTIDDLRIQAKQAEEMQFLKDVDKGMLALEEWLAKQ